MGRLRVKITAFELTLTMPRLGPLIHNFCPQDSALLDFEEKIILRLFSSAPIFDFGGEQRLQKLHIY